MYVRILIFILTLALILILSVTIFTAQKFHE